MIQKVLIGEATYYNKEAPIALLLEISFLKLKI